MAKVRPARVTSGKPKRGYRETLAELCYYYPRYSLAQARKLPAKDVVLLLKTAKRLEAEKYTNLVQIAAAPHTKKGKGVDKLIEAYKKVMNG